MSASNDEALYRICELLSRQRSDGTAADPGRSHVRGLVLAAAGVLVISPDASDLRVIGAGALVVGAVALHALAALRAARACVGPA